MNESSPSGDEIIKQEQTDVNRSSPSTPATNEQNSSSTSPVETSSITTQGAGIFSTPVFRQARPAAFPMPILNPFMYNPAFMRMPMMQPFAFASPMTMPAGDATQFAAATVAAAPKSPSAAIFPQLFPVDYRQLQQQDGSE
ncbi:unnamed protein product [Caenorhabditis auriculariae]|uniref:Uncharacterized protein n=1 Tax=Caenorhabditis auriculariae TaxID=2777116 RepID=A0A8S1HKJ0_9PELO|nr:unnamed protein product [Caenorhabditis auriculariae]